MKNEIKTKENKIQKHTEAIKDKNGKAIGHKTTAKTSGKNWKAEASHAKAKNEDFEMESYSESYEYQSPDFDEDNDTFLKDED